MVEEYVYIGRRRHWARTLVYGVLSLGVYGRVLLYKQVKEIDGHRALFIDIRIIGALLILPILGPLAVKLRLRRLVAETVERDLTHPPVRTAIMLLGAFVPLVPLFHIHAQHHLNIYWRRQQKIEDVKRLRADIARLSSRRKTDAVKEELASLEERVERRERALKDEEEAARAIRQAEAERKAAERELKRARRGPVRRLLRRIPRPRLPKRRARPEEAAAEPAETTEAAREASPGVLGRVGGSLRSRKQARAEGKREKAEAKAAAKAAKKKERDAKAAAKKKEKEQQVAAKQEAKEAKAASKKAKPGRKGKSSGKGS